MALQVLWDQLASRALKVRKDPAGSRDSRVQLEYKVHQERKEQPVSQVTLVPQAVRDNKDNKALPVLLALQEHLAPQVRQASKGRQVLRVPLVHKGRRAMLDLRVSWVHKVQSEQQAQQVQRDHWAVQVFLVRPAEADLRVSSVPRVYRVAVVQTDQ